MERSPVIGLVPKGEAWHKADAVCDPLSEFLVKLVSDIGEKVDFHLLLLSVLLQLSPCFRIVKLPTKKKF